MARKPRTKGRRIAVPSGPMPNCAYPSTRPACILRATHANDMKITYYLEVVSSWCHWADPMWAELRERYAGRAEFRW